MALGKTTNAERHLASGGGVADIDADELQTGQSTIINNICSISSGTSIKQLVTGNQDRAGDVAGLSSVGRLSSCYDVANSRPPAIFIDHYENNVALNQQLNSSSSSSSKPPTGIDVEIRKHDEHSADDWLMNGSDGGPKSHHSRLLRLLSNDDDDDDDDDRNGHVPEQQRQHQPHQPVVVVDEIGSFMLPPLPPLAPPGGGSEVRLRVRSKRARDRIPSRAFRFLQQEFDPGNSASEDNVSSSLSSFEHSFVGVHDSNRNRQRRHQMNSLTPESPSSAASPATSAASDHELDIVNQFKRHFDFHQDL